MLELLVLGFFLTLDNFRSSIVIGTVPFGIRRAVQIAVVFGVWDGVAPLAGGVLGHYLGKAIGPIADYVGPAVLGLYGVYLLVEALRNPEEPDKVDHPWVTLFGMPLSLSLDNLIAGTGVGLLGFSPYVAAVLFGAMTAVMTFVGLLIGRFASLSITRLARRRIRIRPDLVSGIALVAAAVVFPVVFSAS